MGISLVRFRLVLENVKFYPSAYFPLPAFILVSCLGSNSYFYFTDKGVNILHCLIYILLNWSPFMFICGDQKTCACLTLSPDFKNNFLKQKCKRGYQSNYHYISSLKSSLQKGFISVLHKGQTLPFPWSPLRPTQTNSWIPAPTPGNTGRTIRDYGPRAAKETTFSVTVQIKLLPI